MASTLEQHAEQLSALGHPIRLKVLRFVVKAGPEGAAAGEIQNHVQLPASTLSHHLKRLVEAGVMSTRCVGTFHHYAADYAQLRALTDYLWDDCCKRGTQDSCC
jgi:DNA-binding transcriptional ArsR family regulator